MVTDNQENGVPGLESPVTPGMAEAEVPPAAQEAIGMPPLPALEDEASISPDREMGAIQIADTGHHAEGQPAVVLMGEGHEEAPADRADESVDPERLTDEIERLDVFRARSARLAYHMDLMKARLVTLASERDQAMEMAREVRRDLDAIHDERRRGGDVAPGDALFGGAGADDTELKERLESITRDRDALREALRTMEQESSEDREYSESAEKELQELLLAMTAERDALREQLATPAEGQPAAPAQPEIAQELERLQKVARNAGVQLQQYMLALEGARQAVLGCDLNGTKMANLARDLQVVLDGLARQGLLGTEAQRTLQKARELRAYTDASRRLEGIVTRMMEDLSKVIT